MALTLEANYSKKLGLPGYSSHQYSVTVRTEVTNIEHIETESARLYTLLQQSVDKQIQQTGFLPAATQQNGGNGSHRNNGTTRPEPWNCSPKQRELIEKIVRENQLDKNEIEQLALDRFGKSIKSLDRLEASGLIDELLERHGGKNGRSYSRSQPAGAR